MKLQRVLIHSVSIFFISLHSIFLAGCAHKESSADARKRLDSKWEEQLGQATKSELIEDFGSPEWCRKDDAGEESCRFYRRKNTQWVGEKKTDRKAYSAYDEVLADFDSTGRLKTFKANAQR